MDLPRVQRVAVRADLGAGRRVATWLRHGETPLDALGRAAGGPVQARAAGTRSQVMTRPDLGLLVHVIEVRFTVPGSADGELPGAPEPDLFAEPPPTDHVDHLVEMPQDGPGAWGDDEPVDVVDPAVPAPLRVQRPSAYAVVTDGAATEGTAAQGAATHGRILLTRLARAGRWTLPGGGIDFGESPLEAVQREAYEETGLALSDVDFLDVGSAHWTGHAPNGRLEDFHAVQVLHRARVTAGAEPVVVEVDGSTDHAAWVNLVDIPDLQVTSAVTLALQHLKTPPR